jgi:hypothetical protein
MKIKKLFTTVGYFLAGIASVEVISFGLELMNKRSTLLFWTGLGIVITAATFIGVTVYKVLLNILKTKNK